MNRGHLHEGCSMEQLPEVGDIKQIRRAGKWIWPAGMCKTSESTYQTKMLQGIKAPPTGGGDMSGPVKHSWEVNVHNEDLGHPEDPSLAPCGSVRSGGCLGRGDTQDAEDIFHTRSGVYLQSTLNKSTHFKI
ncbi:uncharacterized protein LOC144008031 [Festucalex cinctus]